jgi:hypothetical protein
MPTIRCSNEVYKLLQDKASQSGEPISIILDRVIWGLETLTHQKHTIEPPVSPPAATKAKIPGPAASPAVAPAATPGSLQALVSSLLQTPK